MGIRVKPNDTNFEVCIDIENDEIGRKYFIYKQTGDAKLWLTKDLKLVRYQKAKAYVREWGKVAKIVSKIFTREILE
jgi:hypothetical protein